MYFKERMEKNLIKFYKIEKNFYKIFFIKMSGKTNSDSNNYNSENNFILGTCCFCGDECNKHSQACGRCSRNWNNGISLIPVSGFINKIRANNIGHRPLERSDIMPKDIKDDGKTQEKNNN